MKLQTNWYTPFEKLNLFGGALTAISDNSEDMLEIRWNDGMMIDVGLYEYDAHYHITTVPEDSIDGWNNPLSVIVIKERDKLLPALEKEIKRCRTAK